MVDTVESEMRAVVYTRYGGPEVLRLETRPVPQVGPGEVLVRVVATSLNASDWEYLAADPAYARMGGLLRPRQHILGSDVAGHVAEVGPGVEGFAVGDRVVGDVLMSDHKGGLAEYAACPADMMVHVPEGMSFVDASCLPQAGVVAAQAMYDDGAVEPGHRVLIIGAGGGSGTFAIQIAKAIGAEVTAVDRGDKADYMRSVGADHTIDYRAGDYTRSGEQYDFVLNYVAYDSIFGYRRLVAPGGRYSVVGGSVPRLLQTVFVGGVLSRLGNRRLGVLVYRAGREPLGRVMSLWKEGIIQTRIAGCYPLEDAPEAFRRLGSGAVTGKVVIRLRDDE